LIVAGSSSSNMRDNQITARAPSNPIKKLCEYEKSHASDCVNAFQLPVPQERSVWLPLQKFAHPATARSQARPESGQESMLRGATGRLILSNGEG
jgi:hypothetical protein